MGRIVIVVIVIIMILMSFQCTSGMIFDGRNIVHNVNVVSVVLAAVSVAAVAFFIYCVFVCRLYRCLVECF